jgi:hypothetical protein
MFALLRARYCATFGGVPTPRYDAIAEFYQDNWTEERSDAARLPVFLVARAIRQ